MYEITYAKNFKKDFKKISNADQEHTLQVLERLANNEILESKYKDHALSGDLSGARECHIRPDLLLVYRKKDNVLELDALRIGSHSKIFKK